MDSSKVKKGRKKTWIYDLKKNTIISKGPETKNLTSNKEFVNHYDRFEHKYPKPLPLVVLGFNRDDIFYIGGGYSIRKFGFRKKPYAHKHAAKLHYSFSHALAASYYGDFRKIMGPMNMEINTHFLGPNYKSQYFGQGNETTMLNSEVTDFHSADFDEIWFAPNFYVDTKYQHHKLNFGPIFQHIDVKEEGENNFINSPAAGIPAYAFSSTNYWGGQLGYTFNRADKKHTPTQGLKWQNQLTYQKSMDNSDYEFIRWSSQLSMYLPLRRLRSVVASRTGISTLTGDYEFYHSNFIGGQKTLLDDVNLSGYQRNRFAGKSAFFQNIECRTRLFENVKIILPIDIGLVANYDVGRVWADGEQSNTLHSGYGIGITGTVSIYPVFMVHYTWSKEDSLFLLSTRTRF